MDYRMWKCTANAGENCVPLIKASMKTNDGINSNTPLQFVAFEAASGTKFYLNDSKEPMEVPSTGKFITPFDGQRGMKIWSLKFKNRFSGNIYYIV